MADRVTAERQLARILELLPRAAREGGVRLSELAAEMGVKEEDVLKDLAEVYTRAFYQPAGAAEDVQVVIDAEHVSVWTKGEFRRPVRLSPRESLALSLALRTISAGEGDDGAGAESDDASDSDFRRLAGILEARLLDARGSADGESFAMNPLTIAPGGTHGVIADAARDRRRCRIEYLKSGASEPSSREIDPYVLVSTQERWYTIGHCHQSSCIRIFRTDRILSASALPATFELPESFDVSDYLAEGRVYRAADYQDVTVRYSPAVARWISELGPVERLDDGGVLVTYSVADLSWIVRHVLEHGPDAVLVDPPEARAAVLNALRHSREGGDPAV